MDLVSISNNTMNKVSISRKSKYHYTNLLYASNVYNLKLFSNVDIHNLISIISTNNTKSLSSMKVDPEYIYTIRSFDNFSLHYKFKIVDFN